MLSKIHIERLIGITLLGCAVCLLAFIGIFSESVSAESEIPDWSWSTQPTVYSSDVTSDIDTGVCPDAFQSKEISGYSGMKKMCINSGDLVKFGRFYMNDQYYASVGFRYDTKMYLVNGICKNYDDCLYLPGTDTLVVKRYITSNRFGSLIIYKNLLKRLVPVKRIGPVSSLVYGFDDSNPDYIFKTGEGDGYAWPIGGIGASNNGRWLVVEILDRGIGVLDIYKLEMKRIDTSTVRYGRGSDPALQLSVSNSGKQVAAVGYNVGLYVYDVVDGCGDVPGIGNMGYYYKMTKPCLASPINSDLFMQGFSTAFVPKFDDIGAELRFNAISYKGEMRRVALRASGYEPKQLEYLALGDSFTSGEGEISDSNYLNGTNDEYEKCHLSDRSYPFLLANKYQIGADDVKSVACSGATTGDVIGDDSISYKGQKNRLGPTSMNLDSIDTELAKDYAKYNFTPGRIHQEVFVGMYSPKVITIGIGGNDISFMEKLKSCVSLGNCDEATDIKKREQTAAEIKNLFSKLVDTYQKIHKDSPYSKIFAVSYPLIIDENGSCSLANGWILGSVERKFMNEGVKYLNTVIRSAAKAAGIGYLDIQDGIGGQVLCGGLEPTAVRAISRGDDFNPLFDWRWTRILGNESFHPNHIGHLLGANKIIADIGDKDIFTYEYCYNNDVFCPDSTVVAPEPSSESINYWTPEGKHDYPQKIGGSFVTDSTDLRDVITKNIDVPPLSFEPGSSVDFQVHSNSVSLEQFVVSDDGSLKTTVVLPADIEEGYHSYHLIGLSYSGQPIDLYQYFVYQKSPAIMADDSGIDAAEGGDAQIGNNVKTTTFTNIALNKPQSGVVELGHEKTEVDIESDYSTQNDSVDMAINSKDVLGVVNNHNEGSDGLIAAFVAMFIILVMAISTVVYRRLID